MANLDCLCLSTAKRWLGSTGKSTGSGRKRGCPGPCTLRFERHVYPDQWTARRHALFPLARCRRRAGWKFISFHPPLSTILTTWRSIRADPQIVYASGGTSLQRSVDGGETWETLSAPGYVFTAVSSELLYAAGGTDYCGPGMFANLARSEDGGQTWVTFPLGCLMDVEQIAVLPSQPDVVYLSVLHYAAPSSTLLKSMMVGKHGPRFPCRILYPQSSNC